MTEPLERYGLIADGESAALVCDSGSIDWLCWPRFDSDACFAALLGREGAGYWQICPRGEHVRRGQRYREDTLLLETDFATSGGAMRVLDAMPLRDRHGTIVRRVIGLRGEVAARMEMRLRFGYGAVPPWAELQDRRFIAIVGPDQAVLYSDVPLQLDAHDAIADFTLREGQSVDFVLRFGSSIAPPAPPIDVDAAIGATEHYWREWIGRFDKPTAWPGAVRRSLLTLKALINRPTGGVVAAPSCSLPEVPGGAMNWDYRYCWLRDSTFCLAALLNAGYREEAEAWRDWLLRAVAGSPEHIQIMYRLDGGREIDEWQADWLAGYAWSRPVRIGNAAARQRQLDVYGELIDAFDLAHRAGIDHTQHSKTVERALVDRLESTWREPGHGIWEARGEPRHYVYSKVMAWVGIDRFLRRQKAGRQSESDFCRRIHRLRDTIHREVCEEGYHSGLDSFVRHYGSQEIDASLLLIPTLHFLPADDPRVRGTVARVERELMDDGLVYRNVTSRESGAGAFLVCNCWLSDCYQAQGRQAEARACFERLLSVRGEVGLLSEEYNIADKRLIGNFPQALSHLGVVTTALGLNGEVYQRGGG
ncbi:MAG TPA: glycoside hydrolase family 15 protein [Pseudolabrys sp.]|nr:glycoside hydrolase family 15 protein [Pseudolabrys sp.]